MLKTQKKQSWIEFSVQLKKIVFRRPIQSFATFEQRKVKW